MSVRRRRPTSWRGAETSWNWNRRRADRRGGEALPARDIIFHVQNQKVSASPSPRSDPAAHRFAWLSHPRELQTPLNVRNERRKAGPYSRLGASPPPPGSHRDQGLSSNSAHTLPSRPVRRSFRIINGALIFQRRTRGPERRPFY